MFFCVDSHTLTVIIAENLLCVLCLCSRAHLAVKLPVIVCIGLWMNVWIHVHHDSNLLAHFGVWIHFFTSISVTVKEFLLLIFSPFSSPLVLPEENVYCEPNIPKSVTHGIIFHNAHFSIKAIKFHFFFYSPVRSVQTKSVPTLKRK